MCGEKEFEANIWGCKRLNMPVNEWGGGWLDYGSFDKSGVWHFDKDRIRHELAISLKENELEAEVGELFPYSKDLK